MAKRIPILVYEKCDPAACDPQHGRCAAARGCPARIMTQVDRFDPPLISAAERCKTCGDCAKLCPLGAVHLVDQ